jgi:DNA topoisomerase-3
MQDGKMSRDEFMAQIVEMTEHIVGQAKNFEHDTIPGDFGALATPCPKCGGEVHENYKKFACIKCDFAFWKILAGRQLEASEAETLITKRDVGPLDGFRSRQGRAFSANLILNKELGVEFSWGDQIGDDEEPDFSDQEALGKCPKCDARVFETPNAYVCEKAVGATKTCDFRSGRTILKRAIERAEMAELLAKGKTHLLDNFISKKGRPFSAFLVKQPDGKIGFEFEQRDPATAKGARAVRAPAGALRILGKHPVDGAPVSVYAGRYGPYVKHGDTNATIREKEKADSISLEEALALLEEKGGLSATASKPKRASRVAAESSADAPVAKARTAAKASKPTATKKPVARKRKAS